MSNRLPRPPAKQHTPPCDLAVLDGRLQVHGVPLAQRRDTLKCGLGVVDLRTGQMTALLEFQTAVEEIFDVQVLPGLRFPEVVGFQKDAIQHTFIVPHTWR
jgi:hypothetical protein